MPFEGKGLASKDAHCGEKSPTIEETSLAWRKARLLNGNDKAIVRYISVNHDFLVRLTQQQASGNSLLYLSAQPGPSTCALTRMYPLETKLRSYN